MVSNNDSWLRVARSEAGLSLLEVLVASAIFVMAMTLSTPVAIMALKDQQVLHDQTERYEALRLPALFITQDVRESKSCAAEALALEQGGSTYAVNALKLVKNNGTIAYYLPFRFERLGDGSVNPASDPTNLHRWEGQNDGSDNLNYGGDVKDDLIGTNLVFATPDDALVSTFRCTIKNEPFTTSYYYNFSAEADLVTPAASGSAKSVALQVIAFPRQRPNW